MSREDITGERFGLLTAVKRIYAPKDKYSSYMGSYWLCKCDCGNEKVVKRQCLQRGYTQSCGCLRRKKHKKGVGKISNEAIVIERAHGDGYIATVKGERRYFENCVDAYVWAESVLNGKKDADDERSTEH